MAYSPLDQGALLGKAALKKLAGEVGCTPAQLAIAWLLAQPGVVTIPKSSTRERVKENLGALDVKLSPDSAGRARQGLSAAEEEAVAADALALARLHVGIGDPELRFRMRRSSASMRSASAVAGLVVVAQQMQRAVHDEMRKMIGRRLLLRPRLAPHGLARQHDIAQERPARPTDRTGRWSACPSCGRAHSARARALSSASATVSDFCPSCARRQWRRGRPCGPDARHRAAPCASRHRARRRCS